MPKHPEVTATVTTIASSVLTDLIDARIRVQLLNLIALGAQTQHAPPPKKRTGKRTEEDEQGRSVNEAKRWTPARLRKFRRTMMAKKKAAAAAAKGA